MSDEKKKPLSEGHQPDRGWQGWSDKAKHGPGESKGFQGPQHDEGGEPPPISQIPSTDDDED